MACLMTKTTIQSSRSCLRLQNGIHSQNFAFTQRLLCNGWISVQPILGSNYASSKTRPVHDMKPESFQRRLRPVSVVKHARRPITRLQNVRRRANHLPSLPVMLQVLVRPPYRQTQTRKSSTFSSLNCMRSGIMSTTFVDTEPVIHTLHKL